MSRDHNHKDDHTHDATSARLGTVLALSAVFMVAEVIGGLATGSLALLADAGHMMSDVAALGLALFAAWVSRRPPSQRRTFGNHRAEVLAALANACALAVIAIVVVTEAVARWSSPPEVDAVPMLVIATGGLVVNIAGLLVLRGGKESNLNVRGAFLHVVADALGSLGAMTSGILIWAFDWRWADPAASLVIGTLVLFSSGSLLWRTVSVLMQSVPEGFDVDAVRQAMLRVAHVVDVHDLHAWTLASGRNLLTAHIVVDRDGEWERPIETIGVLLRRDFGVAHVTLQPERQSNVDCRCAFSPTTD